MLHRSFKPAKCKTALKLAIPRLKLMKNKREAQVKQLKRELVQLLESGQDQTARIRVEHVVREEKTVAAYNLLEIYCELIVARMPIIESQKNCPIDLKEAISSVIFASARCEEIPELKDVFKHFTAKYGKEFTSAALELRPNCGVGRMLVEKLSAKAPDGPTKLRILTAIAEEHNIKWDPESFGAKEAKIYEDLLNGPNAFNEAHKISADPPNTQASASHYEQRPPSNQVPIHNKGPPNVQAPIHIEKNDAPASVYEHSLGSPPDPKNFHYSNSSPSNNMSSGTYPPNSKPYGTESQEMKFTNSYSGNQSTFSSPRQHCNMEFKDATAAAQAAAESAERASMAARAAAELSSRGNMSQQHSTESHMSSAHGRRDEELHQYTSSASQNENLAGHPVVNGRNSRNYEKTDGKELHNWEGEVENMYSNIVQSGDKSTHGSFKSTAASFNEKPSLNNQIEDSYSQRNSSEGLPGQHFTEVSIKRNSSENGIRFVGELHDSKNPQNVDNHEVRVREQSSYSSTHSQSNTFTDDHDVVPNLNWQSSENDERSSGKTRMEFVNELHDTMNSENTDYQEVRIRKQSSYSSSHSRSSTFTDDHDVVSNLNRQKSGSNTGEESSPFNDKGSHQRRMQETTDSYDNASAVFDDSGSDNDEYNFDLGEEHKIHGYGMNFSSPGQKSPIHPFTSWSIGQNVESTEKSVSQSHIFSEQLSTPAVPSHGDDLPAAFDDYGPSSEDEEEVEISKFGRSTVTGLSSDENVMGSQQSEMGISSTQLAEGMEGTAPIKDFSLDESKELNLGNLTGGLRNKGYRHPPYLRVPLGNALPSGEAANYTSSRIKQSSPPTAEEASVSSGSYNQEPYSRRGSAEVNRKLSTKASRPIPQNADSSDDDSEEEQPNQPFSSTQEQYNNMPSFEENKRSSSRVPAPYFGSGNSDSDEEPPKASSNTRLNTGFSRRRKASPSNSQTSPNLNATVSSEPTVFSDYGGEKNSFSRSSNANEALPWTRPQKKNSDHWESNRHSLLAEKATSKLVSETNMSSFDEPSRSSEKEQQPPTSIPKITSSGSARTFKAQNLIGEGSSKDNSKHLHLRTTVSSSRSSNSDEALPRTQPQKKNSDHWESNQHSRLSEQATSELVSETKKFSFDGLSRSSEKEQQPPTSIPKITSSGSARTFKSQNLIGEGSSKDNSSHLHLKTTVSSLRSSNSDEALPRTQPQKKNSDHRESNQRSRLSAQATSELVSETKKFSFDGPSRSSEKEQQPATSVPNIISSGSANTLKAQTSHGKGSSKENTSHVHPKLPDYDTLLEHFSSIRQNRQ